MLIFVSAVTYYAHFCNYVLPCNTCSKYLSASSDPRSYRNRWVAGGEFDGENRVLWYNGEPYHVGAAALALWQSSILVEATRDPNATVIVTNVYPTKAEEYLLHALFLQTFSMYSTNLVLVYIARLNDSYKQFHCRIRCKYFRCFFQSLSQKA